MNHYAIHLTLTVRVRGEYMAADRDIGRLNRNANDRACVAVVACAELRRLLGQHGLKITAAAPSMRSRIELIQRKNDQ